MRHSAFVYESQDEYVARAVAFLRDGLEAGEGAVVGNTRHGLSAMREALGPDAPRVTFVDVGAAYTRPARTFAAYNRVYADALEQAAFVRAISDAQVGPEPAEWDLWTGYEALMNRAFAHLPTWCDVHVRRTGCRIASSKQCGGPTPRWSRTTSGTRAAISRIPPT